MATTEEVLAARNEVNDLKAAIAQQEGRRLAAAEALERDVHLANLQAEKERLRVVLAQATEAADLQGGITPDVPVSVVAPVAPPVVAPVAPPVVAQSAPVVAPAQAPPSPPAAQVPAQAAAPVTKSAPASEPPAAALGADKKE